VTSSVEKIDFVVNAAKTNDSVSPFSAE